MHHLCYRRKTKPARTQCAGRLSANKRALMNRSIVTKQQRQHLVTFFELVKENAFEIILMSLNALVI